MNIIKYLKFAVVYPLPIIKIKEKNFKERVNTIILYDTKHHLMSTEVASCYNKGTTFCKNSKTMKGSKYCIVETTIVGLSVRYYTLCQCIMVTNKNRFKLINSVCNTT